MGVFFAVTSFQHRDCYLSCLKEKIDFLPPTNGSLARRVRTNVFVRDMDLLPQGVPDQQRLEVVAEGLPLFHGAQLAIDTTLVSLFRADGVPHIQCADVDGAALQQARRWKERTHPELRLAVAGLLRRRPSCGCWCAP